MRAGTAAALEVGALCALAQKKLERSGKPLKQWYEEKFAGKFGSQVRLTTTNVWRLTRKFFGLRRVAKP